MKVRRSRILVAIAAVGALVTAYRAPEGHGAAQALQEELVIE
jgi:hypothetical protein